MAGTITRLVTRLGWIGMTCMVGAIYFLLGTLVSLAGGDIDVALGGLVITLLLLAIILWRNGR